jgi:hypothetical protein
MNDTILGFDGSASGDTSLVVMHRGDDGAWRVETADGPDAGELARMAAAALTTSRADLPPARPLGDLVADWLEKYADGGEASLELTEWQRDVLRHHYGDLSVRDQLRIHVEHARAALH